MMSFTSTAPIFASTLCMCDGVCGKNMELDKTTASLHTETTSYIKRGPGREAVVRNGSNWRSCDEDDDIVTHYHSVYVALIFYLSTFGNLFPIGSRLGVSNMFLPINRERYGVFKISGK